MTDQNDRPLRPGPPSGRRPVPRPPGQRPVQGPPGTGRDRPTSAGRPAGPVDAVAVATFGPIPSAQIVGPLAAVAGTDSAGSRFSTPDGNPLVTANALVTVRRSIVAKPGQPSSRQASLDDTAVREWAQRTNLGQHGTGGTAAKLVNAVAVRRVRALRAVTHSRLECWMVTLRPDTPVLIGAADNGARDVGMSLHGTYGWPILPGSGLKGAAHAYARDDAGLPDADLNRIFGSPRPDTDTHKGTTDACQGTVVFMDALPMRGDIAIGQEVLTPHVKDYYTGDQPPAEYLQPIPVPFLSAARGAWVAFLVGPSGDAERAAGLLAGAAVTLGLGAKTSAGYGYFDETAAGPVQQFAPVTSR